MPRATPPVQVRVTSGGGRGRPEPRLPLGRSGRGGGGGRRRSPGESSGRAPGPGLRRDGEGAPGTLPGPRFPARSLGLESSAFPSPSQLDLVCRGRFQPEDSI